MEAQSNRAAVKEVLRGSIPGLDLQSGVCGPLKSFATIPSEQSGVWIVTMLSLNCQPVFLTGGRRAPKLTAPESSAKIRRGFRDRLTVGHVALDHGIGVRIPASQPILKKKRASRGGCPFLIVWLGCTTRETWHSSLNQLRLSHLRIARVESSPQPVACSSLLRDRDSPLLWRA